MSLKTGPVKRGKSRFLAWEAGGSFRFEFFLRETNVPISMAGFPF
jgi:hypothetical protein